MQIRVLPTIVVVVVVAVVVVAGFYQPIRVV